MSTASLASSNSPPAGSPPAASSRRRSPCSPMAPSSSMSISVCNANRHTGRLSATVDELARAMTRAPTAVAMNLDELEACAVCRVIRNSGSHLVLEIRDRFWPYEKQQTPGCVPEPEVEFVRESPRYVPGPSLCPGQLLGGRRKDRNWPSSTRRFPGADHTSHPAGMCPQVCLHA